jgi:acetate kinase
MKIVILNSGSSSIKYQLIEMPLQTVICSGMIDRIGLDNSNLSYSTQKNQVEETIAVPDHTIGLEKIAALLLDEKVGVIKSTSEIQAVGHRVVHGGSDFSDTVVITDEVKDKIKQLFDLAPLHNPANLEGITVAETIFSSAKQVAVFDTAFHQTIPVVAHKYAIPNSFLTDNKIRVYGFHGTSHKYVSEKAIDYLQQHNCTASKIITIHLGNGCSMTAIQDGKSIDHTLGFGPMGPKPKV